MSIHLLCVYACKCVGMFTCIQVIGQLVGFHSLHHVSPGA